MTKLNKNCKQAREDLRKWLIKYTGCEIQESNNGKSYPCGTCTVDLLKRIGLNSRKKEYKDHNEEIDRINEVWRAILQIRDAKIK
jgi:hypothetical protein